MQWTHQQQQALDLARRWIDDRQTTQQVFRLFGFAGTGKSTIAHELQDHVGGLALPCAPTWKAASVMARKGLPGASSIHSLIYTPGGKDTKHLDELKTELGLLEAVREPGPGAQLRMDVLRRAIIEGERKSGPTFLLKEATAVSLAPLIILDECSMPDGRVGEDLCSFGTKILALGDPGQLPPVRGLGYFTQAPPDVLLDEVHRQAANSPIIRLATAVREGRSFTHGEWRTSSGHLKICSKIGPEEALASDQILCGTNARRQAINQRHRQLLFPGINSPMPVKDEKLVCLKNDRDLGLMNGTQWIVQNDPQWEEGAENVFARIAPIEGGEPMGVPMEASIFLNEDLKSQWSHSQQFTFGHGMTVHKSQGSEWDNVIVFDDWNNRESKKAWLYTGITRSADDLTLVPMT